MGKCWAKETDYCGFSSLLHTHTSPHKWCCWSRLKSSCQGIEKPESLCITMAVLGASCKNRMPVRVWWGRRFLPLYLSAHSDPMCTTLWVVHRHLASWLDKSEHHTLRIWVKHWSCQDSAAVTWNGDIPLSPLETGKVWMERRIWDMQLILFWDGEPHKTVTAFYFSCFSTGLNDMPLEFLSHSQRRCLT